MKEIKAGTLVKTEQSAWIDRLVVGTMEAFYGDDLVGLANSVAKGHDRAWVSNAGYSITSDYIGKDAVIAKEKADFENATMLYEGELVQIEGRVYAVKILGLRYSDPIHFVAI